ncbi:MULTISPECIES: PepSY domain-containing protein [Halorussus]|uniref:PepSY domain-containing protein n=1 Tax=Halorussus TaxID=1070314 RepID=UPI00209C85CD|nr:PepSY domain-containing protein [Halorussus vallis]USZ76747.1 PepSY domain-containing protein [Halorussus vallis]
MEYHEIASLGLALLLVGSASGVGVAARHSTTAAQPASQTTAVAERLAGVDRAALPGDRTGAALQQSGINLSEVNVSALQAIRLAQNRTNGKPIVVALASQNGTPAFNVTILHQNRSITQVTVDATSPRVTAVRSNVTVVGREYLGGQAFDYGALRPVDEAIRLVENRTNGTVINAGLRRGELTYGVALRTPEGQRTTALVTATTGPILGIRTTNATASTNTTATGS